jgi:hypothetical protein
LAKAALLTSLAEVAVFAAAGSAPGLVREVASATIFAAYLLRPKAPR